MRENNLICYFFCAKLNGTPINGLFGVYARNQERAYRHAEQTLNESLKKLPGTLSAIASVEFVYTNANEFIERAVVASVKKCGPSNVYIVYDDSEKSIKVLRSVQNELIVFVNVSADDFIIKNENINYEKWCAAVAKHYGCKYGI